MNKFLICLKFLVTVLICFSLVSTTLTAESALAAEEAIARVKGENPDPEGDSQPEGRVVLAGTAGLDNLEPGGQVVEHSLALVDKMGDGTSEWGGRAEDPVHHQLP